MEINCNNRWYRFVQWHELAQYKSYDTITLCGLFWRGVFAGVTTLLVFVAMPIALLGLLGGAWWEMARALGSWWLLVKITVGVFVALSYLIYENEAVGEAIGGAIDKSIVINYIKANKKNYCPIITVRD